MVKRLAAAGVGPVRRLFSTLAPAAMEGRVPLTSRRTPAATAGIRVAPTNASQTPMELARRSRPDRVVHTVELHWQHHNSRMSWLVAGIDRDDGNVIRSCIGRYEEICRRERPVLRPAVWNLIFAVLDEKWLAAGYCLIHVPATLPDSSRRGRRRWLRSWPRCSSPSLCWAWPRRSGTKSPRRARRRRRSSRDGRISPSTANW